MFFPGLDLRYICRQFDAAAPTVVDASRRAGNAADSADHSPHMLQQAMLRLLKLLRIIETRDNVDKSEPRSEIDLNELGDCAIQMLSDLSAAAGALQLERQSLQLEDLTLPMALWIARHGGTLKTLTPIVNALARLANTLHEPPTLSQLYLLSSELERAIDDTARHNLDKTDPDRPWRQLLMNQAIIATRSHRAELIEEAFQRIADALPEEAPDFFEEGMQQVEQLGYPPGVKQTVEKFYTMWSLPRTLH